MGEDVDQYRSYMHEGGLSCPACGGSPADPTVADHITDTEHPATVDTDSGDLHIRIDIGACVRCETPLHLVTESALPEAMGVDVCLEVPEEARDG